MKKRIQSLDEFINEGAWGHYPLDNDSASDWKWKFGDMIIKELKDKIKLGIEKPIGENSHNISYVYYSIGMWEFFREKLDTQFTFFTEDEIIEMNDLGIDSCDILLEKHMNYINNYSEPKKVINYLKYIKDKLLEKQKKEKNSKYYEKKRIQSLDEFINENIKKSVSEDDIIKFFNNVCKRESIRTVTVKFGNAGNKRGSRTEFNVSNLSPKHVIFDLSKIDNIIEAVIHEITYIYFLVKEKCPAYDSDKNKKFLIKRDELMDKYEYSFLSVNLREDLNVNEQKIDESGPGDIKDLKKLEKNLKPGYYYEHENGKIIWKPFMVVDMDGGPWSYFGSPFVKRWWKVEK